ncbi:hypothetical protein CRE_04431 [Caenorhabditis remanei]|uniref:ShKT domain-containing protein n=1 Tax=Caenorhabditis remanei TaxID=31234 RepID=E3NQA5_CAERE|nr:hypothetical protein CRE_04431 [Caenorhabditis remanei]
MREKYLLQPLLIFLLSTTVSTQLSCHRIPTSFCCTTRIRDQCPEQCATVQCGTEFIHNFFSTDGSRKPASVSGAHDGNANIGGTGSGDSLRGFGGVDPDSTITSFEKPDQPAPPTRADATWTPNSNSNLNLNPGSNSGDARVGGASRSSVETTTPTPEVPTTTLPTTSSGFPTLIPFSSESWSTVTQSSLAPSLESRPELPPTPNRIPSPTRQSTGFTGSFGEQLPVRIPSPTPIPFNPSPRRDSHRRRTTPDPRIIRPPESLVVIGDYDEDEPPSENAVVDSPQKNSEKKNVIEEEILDSALIRKRREIGEFENRISNNVSIEDNFEILEPMSSEMIDLNWEPQPSILHFHEFKSSTRAITTMHDSIEMPNDFGEKENVDLTIQTFQAFHQAWFRCSRRNQISTSSEGYCGISDQYKHQLFAVSQFLWG